MSYPCQTGFSCVWMRANGTKDFCMLSICALEPKPHNRAYDGIRQRAIHLTSAQAMGLEHAAHRRSLAPC